MQNNTLDFGNFSTKEIRLESSSKFTDNFFGGVYQSAISKVEEILDNLEMSSCKNTDEMNNIIAFTGERGTGKTTTMLSVVKYLKDDDREARERDGLSSKIKEYRFECIPTIDPSKLTQDENIITLVLAHIYEEFQRLAREHKYSTDNDKEGYLEKLREGVRKCQEIYNVVKVKYSSFSENMRQNVDVVRTFGEIAKATTLREMLQELVDIYLSVLEIGRNKRKSVLIISIDDLDTNIQNAYALAEDIRCFFMIPRVIIMMAIKLEQLNDVIQLKFLEDFKYLSKEELRMDSSIENMATKYLEKLIPHDRRIIMPEISFQSLQNYKICTYLDENGKEYISGVFKHGIGKRANRTSKNLVDVILNLLYQKTGIILVKDKSGRHDFIPCNLRTLHQVIEIFEGLEDISLNRIKELRISENTQDDTLIKMQQTLLFNLDKAEKYILDNATNGSMPNSLVEILHKIPKQPIEILNAYVVRHLCDALENENEKYNITDDPVVRNFISKNVHPDLVTVGDICYLLDKLIKSGTDVGIRQFVMSVKILYSILMIRLLFALGAEPQYEIAEQLLGSSICNPAVRLLPGVENKQSYEWMPNIKVNNVNIKMGTKRYSLDGKEWSSEESNGFERDVEIDTIIKMSFWVMGFYRMKRTNEYRIVDPHIYTAGEYPLTKYRRNAAEDINSSIISFHWMSFICRTLNPEKNMKAMLHLLVEKFGCKDSFAFTKKYKDMIKAMNAWRQKYICIVPVYSIDVIDALVNDMHDNRYEYDNEEAKDKKVHGYVYFMESLKTSLKNVLIQSSINCNGKNESVINDKEMAIEECPVLLISEKPSNKEKKLDEELNWLNM